MSQQLAHNDLCVEPGCGLGLSISQKVMTQGDVSSGRIAMIVCRRKLSIQQLLPKAA